MSSQAELTPEQEESIVVQYLRQAREFKFADILISFDKGRMEKCDLTIKKRGESLRNVQHLKES